jgi:hypothetical protein
MKSVLWDGELIRAPTLLIGSSAIRGILLLFLVFVVSLVNVICFSYHIELCKRGTFWGDNGYAKVVRGINNIAIESDCDWAVPKVTW